MPEYHTIAWFRFTGHELLLLGLDAAAAGGAALTSGLGAGALPADAVRGAASPLLKRTASGNSMLGVNLRRRKLWTGEGVDINSQMDPFENCISGTNDKHNLGWVDATGKGKRMPNKSLTKKMGWDVVLLNSKWKLWALGMMLTLHWETFEGEAARPPDAHPCCPGTVTF